MASNVRSAVVRLEAMVAGYIRDINRAGDATEKAFDRVHASTARAREDLVGADRAAGKLASTTRLVSPSMQRLSSDIDRVHVSSVRGTASIDQLSGRLRLLLEAAATLGPGLIPFGGAGLAALAGLAGVFGAATVGALGLFAATRGVGDALEAVEKARLEPTAENLKAAEEAMSRIAPEAREFVTHFQELRPILRELRDAGAEEFFPGLTASLGSLEKLSPVLREFMAGAGAAGGNAIESAAESLTTDRWSPFLDFLVDEVPQAIEDVSHLVGSLSHGAAQMWMAFDPSNDRFVNWLLDVGEGFDRWASSAEGREDIEDFLDYVEKTAPKAGDFLVGTADAVTEVVQAAAPLGGPVLESLTAVMEVIAALADSDLGTPLLTGLAALSLYTRATKLLGTTAGVSFRQVMTGQRNLSNSAVSGFRRASGAARTFGTDLGNVARYGRLATDSSRRLTSHLKTAGRTAGLVGGLAVAATGAADSIGLTNAASLGLMGTMAGPWGAAIGAGAGLVLDLKSNYDGATASIKEMQEAIDSGDLSAMEAHLDAFQAKFAKYLDDESFGDVVTGAFNGLFSGGQWVAELNAGQRLQDKVAATTARNREAQLAFNDALREGGLAAAGTKYGLEGLVDALNLHQSTIRGALDAQYAWGQAVINARQQMRDGKDGFNEFTEAGQQNMDAVLRMADVWNRDMDAAREAGLTYTKVRDQIIEFAIAQGKTREAAEDLARDLIAIPDKLAFNISIDFEREKLEEAKAAFDSLPRDVRTDIKADGIPQTEAEVDALVRKYKLTEKERRALVTLMDQASPTIRGIIARLNEIKDRNVTVTTTFRNFYENVPKPGKKPKSPSVPGLLGGRDGNASTPDADGGFHINGMRRFAEGAWGADGRYYSRTPQIVPGGANILWGEEETGWEAYISGKPGMRNRNLMILDEAARRLGVRVTEYANGGVRKLESADRAGKPATVAYLEPLAAGKYFIELLNGAAYEVSRQGLKGFDGWRKALARLEKVELKNLQWQLAKSEKALDRERRQRDAVVEKMNSLRDDVASNLRSDLFAQDDSDPWRSAGRGTSYDAVMSTLNQDIATASALNRNIATLKKKGLDGAALEELLRNADAATVANFASFSAAQLAKYESRFEQRFKLTEGVGRDAGFAAFGTEQKQTNRELREARKELREIKAAIREEERESRDSQKRGSSNGARSRKKSKAGVV